MAPAPEILAIITGERGRREITLPLAAVGQTCLVLDWGTLCEGLGSPYLRFVKALWRLVRCHRGADIFTDMNSAFLAVIVLFAKLHGSRVILRLRGDPFTEVRDQLAFHRRQREWPQWARSFIARLVDPPLFAFVDRFVPVSHWIVRRLPIDDRSAVVRIPLAIEQFPARQHTVATPLRLLAVTNFNFPQKVAALGRFLEAYGEFLRANGMLITVAGAGIAWQSFSEQHAAHAEMLGFVRDVARLYTEHDVFVHFSDLDAFPYVVLEAQAAGLPVLVNRDCGMLEQVEHGRTGLIVDLDNCDALQAHLRTLRDSPEARASLGATAREHVAATYSLAAIGEGLLRAIRPAPAKSAASVL